MTTTIRATCSSCGQVSFLPPNALVLSLPPATADPDDEPTALHACPLCAACTSRTVSWRNAVHLMDAGVTTLVAPLPDEVAPQYPERRPATTAPMTLDDLIDLLASLEPDASTA